MVPKSDNPEPEPELEDKNESNNEELFCTDCDIKSQYSHVTDASILIQKLNDLQDNVIAKLVPGYSTCGYIDYIWQRFRNIDMKDKLPISAVMILATVLILFSFSACFFDEISYLPV